MTHKTQGIVLRSVKYGDTSLILSVFTEQFGNGSYIINGVRTEKSGGGKAALFQPGEWLSMEVYHAEGKSLNRIKEATRFHLFQNNPVDVLKHNSVLFMMELLNKCLKHPERNTELFEFCAEALLRLDNAKNEVARDIMVGFALKLPDFLGYGIIPPSRNTSVPENVYLDLREGSFTPSLPDHPCWLSGTEARKAASLLNDLNHAGAETTVDYPCMLQRITEFYSLHNPEFGQMRTLQFMQEMIS